jgi:hypothetical protein
MQRNRPDPAALPQDLAERVLGRAAELDAAQRDAVPVARLREAAEAAGIAPAAFDEALSDVTGHRPGAPVRVPFWVRFCLFGVVDRRVALVYYWCFAVGLVLGPVLSFMLPVSGRIRLGLGAFLLAWMTFGVWSTARAVRWMDRHGWDKLT